MEMKKLIPKMKSITANILGNSIETEIFSANETSFCVIVAKNLENYGLLMRGCEPHKIVLSRYSDGLQNAQVVSSLKDFMRIIHHNRGDISRAVSYIAKKFPSITVSHESIRNAVLHMDTEEDDSQKFVDSLRSELPNGSVEFLHIVQNDSTGLLTSATWCFKGAQEIVSRCCDVVFWDSTHNVTPYSYKLATFTVVDSGYRSRAFFLSLNIYEDSKSSFRMLSCWKKLSKYPCSLCSSLMMTVV